jgi:hypothetical protein
MNTMSMKKTDLEKNKMVKTATALKGAPVKGRFAGALPPPDRKEQRKLDQAAGLVPFACKLPSELVKSLSDSATAKKVGLNELVAELLTKALKK